MGSSKEFRTLLFSLAHQLNQQEVDAMVWIYHLPNEFSGKSGITVLQYMEQQGMFSHSKPEELIEVLKSIKKNDLCKQVKEFSKNSKKSRKSSSSEPVKDQSVSLRFDSAEEGVLHVKESLDVLEGSVKSCNVKRIEEVYNEAKQAADNLLLVLRRARALTRTLLASDRNSSPQTRPREKSPASPGPMGLAVTYAEQRTQQLATPPQMKLPETPPKQVVRLNRSQSLKCIRPALPHLPYKEMHIHEEVEEEEDEHDYDEPFVFSGQRSGHTLPRKTSEITKMLQHSPPSRENFRHPGVVLKQPISSGAFLQSSSVPKPSTHVESSSPNSSARKQSTSTLPSHPPSPAPKHPPPPPPKHPPPPSSKQPTPPPPLGADTLTNIQQIKESLRRTKEKYGPQAHPISVPRATETEVGYYTDSSSTGDSGFEEIAACVSTPTKNPHRPVPVPKPRNKSSSRSNYHRGPWQPDHSPEIEEEVHTDGIVEAEYVNVSQLRHR